MENQHSAPFVLVYRVVTSKRVIGPPDSTGGHRGVKVLFNSDFESHMATRVNTLSTVNSTG